MKQYRKLPAFHGISAFTHRITWSSLAASCALFMMPALAAQTPKPSPAVIQTSASTPAVTQQTPASLADQPPTAATVTFRDGKLTVHAHNSTLLQILQSIRAQTGMQVEGIPGNHRIFGIYGPGKPSTVVSDLLSGFGYNFMVVGTASNGAPKKLLIAGMAGPMPEPTQPVHNVQPAPRNTMPQPQFGQHPTSYPPPRAIPPPRRPETRSQQSGSGTSRVPSPQEILKKLEAMRARQQSNAQ